MRVKGRFVTDDISVVPMNFIVTSKRIDAIFRKVCPTFEINKETGSRVTINDKIDRAGAGSMVMPKNVA